MGPGDGRLEAFVEMSALLTGFGPVHLFGTGMAARYLRAVEAALPAGVLDELLDAWARLPDGAAREDSAGPAILRWQVARSPPAPPISRSAAGAPRIRR